LSGDLELSTSNAKRLATEKPLEMAATKPGIFLGGLRLLLANKRTLLWSYLALLFVGLVGGASMHARIGPFLDHSLAAQKLAGGIDAGYYAELYMHANEHDPGSGPVTTALTLLSLVLSFFFAAGIVYVFLSGEKPRLAVILGRGVEYFWRFFRLVLFAAILGGPILGVLAWLRSIYLKSADEKFVEAAYDLRAGLTLAVLLLVAVILRIWFDLAEVYVVKLGTEGDRRVRKSLGPSLRLFRRNFLRVFFSYFAAGTLGWLAFAVFLWIWLAGQTSHLIVPVFFWSQIALVFLLASRIWQRGILTALVLAEPVPVVVVEAAFVEAAPVVAVLAIAPETVASEGADPARIDSEFVEPLPAEGTPVPAVVVLEPAAAEHVIERPSHSQIVESETAHADAIDSEGKVEDAAPAPNAASSEEPKP
jgi:hypothetical protein